MVWGCVPHPHEPARGAVARRRRSPPCRLSVTQPLPELVARLNDFQPQHLNGYPSIAARLADEQLAGRLRLRLEGIATSSEPLTPELRDRLEQAFGVRPYDFYATTEGLYGHECPEGSMHLFDDMCIVENVDEDGDPVPPGEIGARLLVTNLFNRAQPLIRFEVTDIVAVEPEPCPCGRSLMRVRSLEGRAEEVLRLGGVSVHPLQFALVTADPDVREFQVVQQGDGAAPAGRAAGRRRPARRSGCGRAWAPGWRSSACREPAVEVETSRRSSARRAASSRWSLQAAHNSDLEESGKPSSALD